MHCLFLNRFTVVLGFLLSAVLVNSASAQLGPYHGYGRAINPYGGYNSAYNTMSRVAESQRSQAQAQVQQRSMAMQQGIRSTMTAQAQARTRQIETQRQNKKDWWFDHLQRQSTQGAPRPAYVPLPTTSGSVPQSAMLDTRPSEANRAATDIIQWPPLLQDALFQQQRARIEKPYRERTPGSSDRPTVAEYEAIAEATAEMKKTLQQVANRVTAADFMATEKFLDTLATEAKERGENKASVLKAATPAEPQSDTPADSNDS